MTPSQLRREGRNAYSPGENPDDCNPYLKARSWRSESNAQNWLDGWNQAMKGWEMEREEYTAIDWIDPNDDLVGAVIELQDFISTMVGGR